MREKAAEINLKYRAEYKKQYDKANKVARQTLKPGDRILVENTHKQGPNPKFHPAFNGPFEVTKIVDLNIHYRDGKKEKTAHMNRVKLAKELTTVIPEASGLSKMGRRGASSENPKDKRANRRTRDSDDQECHYAREIGFPGSESETEGEFESIRGDDDAASDQHIPEEAPDADMDLEPKNERNNGSHGTRSASPNLEGEFRPISGNDDPSTTQHIPGEENDEANGANRSPEDIHMLTLGIEEEDVRMRTLVDADADATVLPPDSPFPPTPAPARRFARARRGDERTSIGHEERRGEQPSVAETKKRKPSGELAQEQKRPASDVSLVRNLRSYGREQMEQSLPQRAREYRSYTRKACAPSDPEPSS